MSKLLGLDAKMRQYAEGERFVESVEAAGGTALLARVLGGARVAAHTRGDPRAGGLGGPSWWAEGVLPRLPPPPSSPTC